MKKSLSLFAGKACPIFGNLVLALLGVCLPSCQNDDIISDETETIKVETIVDKNLVKTEFAEILSKVTYAREDVRSFLRDEAVKQFDRNYDVLYALIKNEKIGEQTFREILVEYSSEEKISEIEQSLPLLNILIPEIAFFDINAANMDCSDCEIPVAISTEKGGELYINGVCEGEIPTGEVPGFHLFVVNENSRVIVEDGVSRSGTANVRFISPNYDGSRVANRVSRADTVAASALNQKMIDAYKYFYKDDGSVNSMSYQRDYIYYGLTPTNPNGLLNRSVTEYLDYIKIDPKAYYRISDQQEGFSNDDPKLLRDEFIKYNNPFSEEDLIRHFWSDGNYNIKIEVVCANSPMPIILLVSVAPKDLWDLNPSVAIKKGNMFHRRRYTYRVDPTKFIAKKYYVGKSNDVSLGKWDLSEEALYRYINIYEEDVASTVTYEATYEATKLTSAKVNGSVKIGLGTDKTTGTIGGDASASTTETVKKTYKVERKQTSDELGNTKIYFYDPIITGKNGNDYILHSYSTGTVEFGIVVK